MISAISWVPKGASRRIPQKLKLSDDELKWMLQVKNHEKMEDMSKKQVDTEPDAEIPESFYMENYDNEDDQAAISNYIGQSGDFAMSDAENDDEKMEEELDNALAAVQLDGDDEQLKLDKEEIEILPSDIIVLVATTEQEEEFSNLEVQVYDQENGSLYVHHEINLPAFPLCLAWMDCAPVKLDPTVGPQSGSFVAVGTFQPAIEIWNLDILDVLEPSAVLGGKTEAGKISSRHDQATESTDLMTGSHTDAVMSLDWNRSHRNMLASGSADQSVKIWDISTQTCLHTIWHHKDKVQSVKWNPIEATILASASFDKSLIVLDARHPDAFSLFPLSAEVESLTWAAYQPTLILASTEDGIVAGFDVRKNGSEPLFRIQAHNGSVAAISFSCGIPGMLATAGADKSVKIWDLLGTNGEPRCIADKAMNVGELFAMSFYENEPFLLGCGGSTGVLALWDTSENQNIETHFGSRIKSQETSTSVEVEANSIANLIGASAEKSVTKCKKKKAKKKKKTV